MNRGPPEIEASEIRIIRSIGSGCYGEVYKGTCRGMDVAVKVLLKQSISEKNLQDFQKEVEIMSSLHHPNVVLFMGACTAPGKLAIVTEYLPRGDLASLLHNPDVEISLSQKIAMAKDAALGIMWLHASNPQILHRDIKPSNFLLDENLRVKVCDFGLSSVKKRGESLVDIDSIPGTPLWMAPEVMNGGEVTDKADVYAFGLLLWEILTRIEPFGSYRSYKELKKAICQDHVRPEIPEDTPHTLANVMTACWHRKAGSRPSFEKICQKLDIALVDCCIPDSEARKLWKKYFLSRRKIKVSQLHKAVDKVTSVKVPADDPRKQFLLRTLFVEQDESGGPDSISIDRFGLATSLFGPLHTPQRHMYQNIWDTLECPWFHGFQSGSLSERLLSGAKPGTFLVRVSGSGRGCLSISKIAKTGRIVHQRVTYILEEQRFFLDVKQQGKVMRLRAGPTMVDFVHEYGDKLSLLFPCPGSPFAVPDVRGYMYTGVEDYDDDEDMEPIPLVDDEVA